MMSPERKTRQMEQRSRAFQAVDDATIVLNSPGQFPKNHNHVSDTTTYSLETMNAD